MKTGVYNQKCTVDFSGVSDYLRKLFEEYRTLLEKSRGRIPKKYLEERFSRYTEALKNFDEASIWDEDEFFKILNQTFSIFSMLDNFPEQLGKLFYRERERTLLSGEVVKRKLRLRKSLIPDIFNSHINRECNDVISIERKNIAKNKWLFDIVTLKKATLLFFKKCLKSILPIKESLEILQENNYFSTRYVYRPYPLATKLWLNNAESILVPQDLKSFLQGAVRYIFSKEWKTSIVLSAITVESILAELYEEEFKKPAPDTPLGILFRNVKEKIEIPEEIVGAIEKTNRARIAAVHRSPSQVSDREATNALHGATNFTLWFTLEK